MGGLGGLDNWRRNKIGRRPTRSNCRLFHSLLSKRCVCAGVREMFENLLVAVALHGGWLGVYTMQHQDISSLSLLFNLPISLWSFSLRYTERERERRWGRESPTPAAYLSFSSIVFFFGHLLFPSLPPSLSLSLSLSYRVSPHCLIR